jgi:K+-transporting ATPase ATPase C chain
MLSYLRPAVALTLFFTLLTGVAYPLAITGIAQVAMPYQANGSQMTENGKLVGSVLIGENWTAAKYFQGRPSATKYDASTSSGSNLGPSSKALMSNITAAASTPGGKQVPADLVTASGSGLDPDISPAAALFQAERVAKARGIDEAAVRELIATNTQPPQLGILGEPHINVLVLNRALDALKP